jgi:5-methylcytosine-specific restriction endonuclease McrA
MDSINKTPQRWEQVAPNVSVKCAVKETISFDDFSIAKGTKFEGIYLGLQENDGIFRAVFDVPAMQKQLAIECQIISTAFSDILYCFRCERYSAKINFIRSSQVRDKSPILSQVCEGCYKRAQSQVSSRRNQANRMGAENTLQASEWLEKLLASQGHCHYCDAQVGYANLIIEHMTPISWKGGHTKENIVPACVPCNCSKGDRDVETWKRSVEAKYLLELLQDHLQLSKFEVTNLAIKYLAVYKGLIAEDVEE